MKIEEITCRVCLDILVKPSILRCGHSFCELCAEECINLSDSCPVCRTKTIGICVPNRIVENLIDNWLETPGNESFRETHRIRKENNKETLLLKNKARIILFTVLNENKEERISIGDVQSMYSKLQSSLGRSTLETCPLLFEQIKKEAVLHEGLFIQIDRNQGEESFHIRLLHKS